MEDMIKETLAKGVERHLAGELDLACQLYDAAIKLQPNHADANHNMGLLKLDKGNDLDALLYLQTALQADTSIAQFWLSYINALVKLERRDEAARIISLAKENGMEGEEFL
jgi:tetratricopeptide (TPR) repeat protein